MATKKAAAPTPPKTTRAPRTSVNDVLEANRKTTAVFAATVERFGDYVKELTQPPAVFGGYPEDCEPALQTATGWYPKKDVVAKEYAGNQALKPAASPLRDLAIINAKAAEDILQKLTLMRTELMQAEPSSVPGTPPWEGFKSPLQSSLNTLGDCEAILYQIAEYLGIKF